jgi:broad specificity phosphatase PhoE
MVTIIYFVHGTTFDNEKDLATGWLPGELSPIGLEQSHQLAQEVAGRQFDAVICSDLERAVETARIAFGQKYDVKQDKRLREANYGDWNGKPDSLFKPRMKEYIRQPFPGGESLQDVEERMRALCADLKKRYDGKRVALLAHQSPQLALEVICNGKTWEQAINTDWRHTKAYQPGWEYKLL